MIWPAVCGRTLSCMGKICKGCKCKNHFVHLHQSVCKVAEEDEEDAQFCIDSVIRNTKKPWTVSFKIKETDVPFKIFQ